MKEKIIEFTRIVLMTGSVGCLCKAFYELGHQDACEEIIMAQQKTCIELLNKRNNELLEKLNKQNGES